MILKLVIGLLFLTTIVAARITFYEGENAGIVITSYDYHCFGVELRGNPGFLQDVDC